MSHFITARTPGSRFKFVLGVLAGSLAGAMGTGLASAATSDADVPSIVVRYSGQSLGTESGVQLLYHRIVVAARQVCPEETVRNLAAHAMAQQCRQQAIARAVQQINNPRLAAMHARNTKNG